MLKEKFLYCSVVRKFAKKYGNENVRFQHKYSAYSLSLSYIVKGHLVAGQIIPEHVGKLIPVGNAAMFRIEL